MNKQNKKIGYGVVGLGRVFNRAHGPMLNTDKSFLKAVFDLDQKKSQDAADKFGCIANANLKELLQDQEIDVVNICTPHDTHTELILKVLDSGKYCLCEKPLCLTPEESEKIAQHPNIDKLFTVYQNRFNPAVKFLTDLVDKEELGKLRLCSVALRWWRPDSYFEDWHGEMKKVGGMLFNQAAHILDIMRRVCGEPEKIHNIIRTFRKVTDVDDVDVANVIFKNGIIGNVEVTTYAKPQDWEVSMLLVGDKGVMKIGGLSINELEYAAIDGKDMAGLKEKYSEQIPDGYGNSHPRVFEALSQYILTGKSHPCLVSGKEGLETTRFIAKFYS